MPPPRVLNRKQPVTESMNCSSRQNCHSLDRLDLSTKIVRVVGVVLEVVFWDAREEGQVSVCRQRLVDPWHGVVLVVDAASIFVAGGKRDAVEEVSDATHYRGTSLSGCTEASLLGTMPQYPNAAKQSRRRGKEGGGDGTRTLWKQI